MLPQETPVGMGSMKHLNSVMYHYLIMMTYSHLWLEFNASKLRQQDYKIFNILPVLMVLKLYVNTDRESGQTVLSENAFLN